MRQAKQLRANGPHGKLRPRTTKLVSASLMILGAVLAGGLEGAGAAAPNSSTDPAPVAHPALARVVGTVTDANEGRPLEGAAIEWMRGDQTVLGSTDTNGAYNFAVPVAGEHESDGSVVSIVAWSNLYAPVRQTVSVRSGVTARADFALRRRRTADIGEIRGRVTNSTSGQVAGGVKLTLTGAGVPIVTSSRDDGTYAFPQVGVGQILTLRTSTADPPCLEPVERSFNMARPIAVQDFPLASVSTWQLHCPSTTETATPLR